MPLSDEDMYAVMSPTSMAPSEIGEIKERQKVSYNWDQFYSLVGKIKKQVNRKPDIVISIGKGGSIPGVILAEMFDITNINLGLMSYNKQHRGKIFEYQSIDITQAHRDMSILLVDDIADSGETFKYASTKLRRSFCEHVETASVFYKPCSIFKPDYFAEEVSEDAWIVQPWENN